jgi:hypothetical protein
MRKTYYFSLITFILLLNCRTKSSYIQSIRFENSGVNSFCGENVAWGIRFTNGFDSDSIKIVHEKDTILIPDVTTYESGCTSTVVFFKKEKENEKFKICINNSGRYNKIIEKKEISNYDSLSFILAIRGNFIPIKTKIREEKYLAINYDNDYKAVNIIQSEKCIICE